MSEVMTAETKEEAALAPSEILERGADLAPPIAARLATPRAQQAVSVSEAIAPQTPDGGLSSTFPSSALPTNIRPSDCGCGSSAGA